MPESPVSSIKDPRLQPFRKPQEDRSVFVVEGARMVGLALEAGWIPRSAVFLDPLETRIQPIHKACAAVAPTCVAGRGVFFKVLGLGYETSTEAIALFPVPAHDRTVLASALDGHPRALVLVGEDIQDPRNVGVLVRTADAFAADAIGLTRSSAFPWSRQSIRSTTGSVFRVHIHLADTIEGLLGSLRELGVMILGSSAGAPTDVETAPIRFPCAVLVGNETTGLTPAARGLCDAFVRIPMGGGAHSLNVTVAAGILMHAVHRRRAPGP